MQAAGHERTASAAPAGSASASLAGALSVLERDGLVAFPTETVWGIAARAGSDAAVSRLRAWKGRDDDKPLSVLVSGLARLEAVADRLPEAARALAERFWPGPLTLIVRCRLALAPGVASALDGANEERAVGFRCSSHPVAAELARAAERAGLGPLTATSLNESGDPPARTRAEAEACLAARTGIDWMTSGEASGEEPSTVVDVTACETSGAPRLVRAGAIPARELGIE